jgi:hypothetical protein
LFTFPKVFIFPLLCNGHSLILFFLYRIIQIISLQLWTSLGDHQALASC